MATPESKFEEALIGRLTDLKYTHRPDIRDRAALEDNFRGHFQSLNRVQLTDGEFKRLLDQIVTSDVAASLSNFDTLITAQVGENTNPSSSTNTA